MPIDNLIFSRILDDVVRVAHPIEIILFGSYASGSVNSARDIDLMVVVPDGTDRKQTLDNINRDVHRPEIPVDVIVVTPAFLSRHHDNPGLIYHAILETGRQVYAA